MKEKTYNLATNAVHAGYSPDSETGASSVPIYQTNSFVFDTTDTAANRFNLTEAGNIYSRLSNPTVDVLDKRVAALEGGVSGLSVATGQSAEMTAILNIVQSGENFISSSSIYGGSYTLFRYTMEQMGIEARFANTSDPASFEALIDDNTKAIYGETIGNPRLDIFPFEEVSKIAKKHGIPLIVDNTMTSPYICKPLDLGADIVIHSASKYLGGHGTTLGGVIVDKGTFDWGNGRFPIMTNPDTSYHDIKWVEEMGELAYINKARLKLLRDTGCAMSPFNAFIILLGIETLPLRMQKHSENAMEIANFLEVHDKVDWVIYPGLSSHADHESAKKYFKNGFSGMIGFGVKGGKLAGKTFIDSTKLCSHLANIGDAKTLVIHPASTTHNQLSIEELRAAGVSEDFIRFSTGIEDVRDIIDDITQALEKI